MAASVQAGTLLTRTIELIKNSDLSIDQLSFETRLPSGWIRKVCNGTLKDPSVNRIQELYEYLSGEKVCQ